MALYRDMGGAITRGDTAALARLWSPGYVYTAVTADTTVLLTRAERLRALAEGRRDTSTAIDSTVVRACTFRTYDTFAAGPCRVAQYLRNGAQRTVRQIVAVALFTRAPGRWQVLATHTTVLSESQ